MARGDISNRMLGPSLQRGVTRSERTSNIGSVLAAAPRVNSTNVTLVFCVPAENTEIPLFRKLLKTTAIH